MSEVMCSNRPMRRNLELEATIAEKYAAVEAFLDERVRRTGAATELRAIGYGGGALVSDATGLSRPTIRAERRELESGSVERGRIRCPGAGRPGIEQSQHATRTVLVQNPRAAASGGASVSNPQGQCRPLFRPSLAG